MNTMLKSKQINFLNKYTIGSWSVNPSTGLIDIEGDFIYENFPREVLYPLRGLRFGEVTGDFIFEAQPSKMDDLEGFPQKVGGNFGCSRCSIKSLKGGPVEVGGSYYCSFNYLKNFEYAPERINGDFIARFIRGLESLDGLPKYIEGDLNLYDSNQWNLEINSKDFITLFLSDVRGEIKLDGRYRDFFNSAISLSVPGIRMEDLIEVMKKRNIIDV